MGSRYGVSEIGSSYDHFFRMSEMGTKRIWYWVIELYAHQIKVPSAIILLISRLTEHKRHASVDPELDNDRLSDEKRLVFEREIIASVRRMLDLYEDQLLNEDEFCDADVRKLILSYRNVGEL